MRNPLRIGLTVLAALFLAGCKPTSAPRPATFESAPGAADPWDGRGRRRLPAQRLPGQGGDARLLGQLVTRLPGHVPSRAVARSALPGPPLRPARRQHRRGPSHSETGPDRRQVPRTLLVGRPGRPDLRRVGRGRVSDHPPDRREGRGALLAPRRRRPPKRSMARSSNCLRKPRNNRADRRTIRPAAAHQSDPSTWPSAGSRA